MKVLILFPLAMFSLFAMGQKIDQDKTDKFNGSRYVSTTREVIAKYFGVPLLKLEASKVVDSNATSYSLVFWFNASTVLSVSDKHNAILKCQTGEVFTLPYSGSYHIYSNGDTGYFIAAITKDQLMQLKEKIVTDIRLENSTYNLDYQIKEKQQKIIQAVSSLIASSN